MTRFRVLLLTGVLALSFNFAGCFEHGGDGCTSAAAAAAAGVPSPTVC